MPEDTTKPDGEIDDSGKVKPVDDRAAVQNQSEVSPEDYPNPASGGRSDPRE